MTYPKITDSAATNARPASLPARTVPRDRHPLTLSEQDESRLESAKGKLFRPAKKIVPKPQGLEVAGAQLTLGELFFILNLCAIAFWIYFFVSPILSCIAGCTILFIAIMRLLGHRPAFIGGTIGFCLAGTLSIGSGLLFQLSAVNLAALAPAAGTFGYCIGAMITELAE
ncbi:MAG: hypothetical protein AB8B50_04735 [Pirellulaceae bacterium]